MLGCADEFEPLVAEADVESANVRVDGPGLDDTVRTQAASISWRQDRMRMLHEHLLCDPPRVFRGFRELRMCSGRQLDDRDG